MRLHTPLRAARAKTVAELLDFPNEVLRNHLE